MSNTNPINPFVPDDDWLAANPMPPGPRPTEEEWREIARDHLIATRDAEEAEPAEPWKIAEEKYRAAGWPDALAKAAVDPFEYAAGIDGLGTVWFSEAEIAGPGWVRLTVLDRPDTAAENRDLPYPFPRGLEVPLAGVRWVADAPMGS